MNKTNSIKKEDDFSLDELGDILSGMPLDVANLQLPSPELRNYYRDEQSRIIRISGEINDYTIGVVDRILYYNSVDKNIPVEERKPIKIYIDTTGGSVPVMWSIMNAIKISKTPVWTINMSKALSAGSQILVAGHKRFAMPGSTVLIHSGSCFYGGTQEQAESAKKYYDAMSKKTDEFLLSRTKIDAKVLKKKAPFDWYISEDEALELGVIDKIVDDIYEIM